VDVHGLDRMSKEDSFWNPRVCTDNGRRATISNSKAFHHYERYLVRQSLPKNLPEKVAVSV
jgi:hypothetical protein